MPGARSGASSLLRRHERPKAIPRNVITSRVTTSTGRSFLIKGDIPEQVGLVDVFRPAGQTPDIARQAVAAGATALWLQLGIASAEARAIAEDAGLLYVEDRCLIIEQRRLNLEAPGR